MQNYIRTIYSGLPSWQSVDPGVFTHSGAPADILLASREGDVARLCEDIVNAGNCDYLTITYHY